MRASLMYRNPRFYGWCMRRLYGRHYPTRYNVVAAELPRDATVVDVCAGDCGLWFHALSKRPPRSYVALDLSREMMAWARRRGIDARVFDVWRDPLPRADYIVMQGALCHFIPHGDEIVDKLLDAAGEKVVISEPVRNMSTIKLPFAKKIGARLTRPARSARGADAGERYTEATLRPLLESFAEFERFVRVPGGKDIVGVLRGRRALAAAASSVG